MYVCKMEVNLFLTTLGFCFVLFCLFVCQSFKYICVSIRVAV